MSATTDIYTLSLHDALPISQAEGKGVVLHLNKCAGGFKGINHPWPGLEPVETAELIRHQITFEPGVETDDARPGQAMPLADLEVSRVVRRGDLQRSGTEVAFHRFVGDDRDEPVGERDADLAADQVSVTFIVRVNRDRGVSEDRLGPDRGDVDVATILELVRECEHLRLAFLAVDLQV